MWILRALPVGPTNEIDIGAYPAGSSIPDQLTELVMAAHAGQSFSEGLDRWEQNY
jgi:hypothetical protein